MTRLPHASWAPFPLVLTAVAIAVVVAAMWLTCT